MTKMRQKYEAFLKEQQELFEEIAKELERKGIYHLGVFNAPRFIFVDDRLAPESKMVYLFFCSMVEFEEVFSPKVNRIMDELDLEKETFENAMKQLIDFGYLVEKNSGLQMAYFPVANMEFLQERLEEAKEFGQFFDQLELMASELADSLLGENGDSLTKERVELLIQALKEGKVPKEIKKPVKVNGNENVQSQIFKHISDEIAQNIPQEAKRIKVEIEFETGIAKVEIG